jgi:lysophospholipase L1-like esterase
MKTSVRFSTSPIIRIHIALAAFVMTLCAVQADEFFIHDGDRVVFLGDSITEQRLYTSYIEAYALSRHPSWKLVFRNAGWGGDTSWLRQRSHTNEAQLFAADDATLLAMVKKAVDSGLSRDVLPLKPTIVTVDFGMNDHEYQAFRPDILRAYISSQTEIARVFAANGIRAVFLTPQPIEDKRPDPDQDVRNISLKKFSEALGSMAAHEKASFVDQFEPYMQAMLRSHDSTIGGGNAVHPGPPGHTIMAWAILKSMGATPLVSSVSIGRRPLRVEASAACRVDNLTEDGDTVSFDRLDDALPMPIDPKADSALAIAPIISDLDVYDLRIAGLPKSGYTISIDGEVAATVSADDLAQGWNLANSGGPITKQSRDLLAMVVRKNDLYFNRWRSVQLFSAPDWVAKGSDLEARRTAELARLDREIDGLEAKIAALRKPRQRHFQIAPAPKDAE